MWLCLLLKGLIRRRIETNSCLSSPYSDFSWRSFNKFLFYVLLLRAAKIICIMLYSTVRTFRRLQLRRTCPDAGITSILLFVSHSSCDLFFPILYSCFWMFWYFVLSSVMKDVHPTVVKLYLRVVSISWWFDHVINRFK